MPKYKLKCFNCGTKFDGPADVFKDYNNFPICSDCLIERLEQDWEYNFAEYVFEKIENEFNRKYIKWHRRFYANHVLCQGEGHEEEYSSYYEHKDNITIIKGKKYCQYCIEVMEFEIEERKAKDGN